MENHRRPGIETIAVRLGDRTYPVLIGAGLIDAAGAYFKQYMGDAKAAVITDDNVAPLYLARVEASLGAAGIAHASRVLPHGEGTKSLARLQELYGFLSESGITRTDGIIALGGGVIGDLAGLAAATWLRGIRFLQIPTSLLAQVDSSVGGKVAVDLPQGKNLVGAFHQPVCVLADPQTLNTLPEDFWQDGMGEVVKYGCIMDQPLFSLLEETAPGGRAAAAERMSGILRHCIGAKAAVVAQDERDTGLRITLNFGHTLGHAAEKLQGYAGLSHGMAVAAGMAAITRISERHGLTEPGTADRLTALEKALGLPCALPEELAAADLIRATGGDKKHLQGKLRLVLLKRIGACFVYPADETFFEGGL